MPDYYSPAGLGQVPQDVVDGLVRDLPNSLAYPLDHRVGVGVGILPDRIECGHSLACAPEIMSAQDRLGVEDFRDGPEDNGFLESLKFPVRSPELVNKHCGSLP